MLIVSTLDGVCEKLELVKINPRLLHAGASTVDPRRQVWVFLQEQPCRRQGGKPEGRLLQMPHIALEFLLPFLHANCLLCSVEIVDILPRIRQHEKQHCSLLACVLVWIAAAEVSQQAVHDVRLAVHRHSFIHEHRTVGLREEFDEVDKVLHRAAFYALSTNRSFLLDTLHDHIS